MIKLSFSLLKSVGLALVLIFSQTNLMAGTAKAKKKKEKSYIKLYYSKTSNIFAFINPFEALGSANVFPHVMHFAGVAGHPNITCSVPQSGHWTLKNLLLGFCTKAIFSPHNNI